MKKKILALCLVVVLVATAITGVTLAYFTDTTDKMTNTFTVGKVELKLDEAVVEQDKDTDDYNPVKPEERTEKGQAYDLHPAQTVHKDPKLTLTTSDGDYAYLAAKVVIDAADLSELYVEEDDAVNFYDFVTGGVTYPEGCPVTPVTDVSKFDEDVKVWHVTETNGYDYYLTQEITFATKMETQEVEKKDQDGNTIMGEDGKPVMEEVEVEVKFVDKVTMCYIFEKEYTNGQTITLFDTLHIPSKWNNAEMAKLEGLTIDVTGYAAQVDGFEDVLEAMSNTFATELSVKAVA